MHYFRFFHLTFVPACNMQVRLQRAEFAVNPQSGYNTLEDFWDGEI